MPDSINNWSIWDPITIFITSMSALKVFEIKTNEIVCY